MMSPSPGPIARVCEPTPVCLHPQTTATLSRSAQHTKELSRNCRLCGGLCSVSCTAVVAQAQLSRFDDLPSAPRSVPSSRYGVRLMDAGTPGVDRPIDVIIADDHSIVRDGIRTVLERQKGEFRVVAEVADVPIMIREVGAHKPDLLT